MNDLLFHAGQLLMHFRLYDHEQSVNFGVKKAYILENFPIYFFFFFGKCIYFWALKFFFSKFT
jgi:hypothetical protein